MTDEIMTELWVVKDDIVKEHGYDVEALVSDLRSKSRDEERRVVELQAEHRALEDGSFERKSSRRP